MVYDFDGCADKSPPSFQQYYPPADPRDLETIVTLLEMAAISLTTVTKTSFTRDELLREAQAFGGAEVVLREQDVDIVLPRVSFLRKLPGRYLQLR